MATRLISIDKLTRAERVKLTIASRKARPTSDQRAAFAELVRAWQLLKGRAA